MPIRILSPAQLSQRMGQVQALCLLDVRTPAEFAQLHAAGAANLPLADLQAKSPPETAGPLILLCQSGARARAAAELLASRGEERDLLIRRFDVSNLSGGYRTYQMFSLD